MTNIEGRANGREFQIWRYGVSHSELLLMAHKNEVNVTRLILLLKGVEEIFLPCTFRCIRMVSVKIDYRTKFIFHTQENQFHIIANKIFEEEDDLEFYQGSKLIDNSLS